MGRPPWHQALVCAALAGIAVCSPAAGYTYRAPTEGGADLSWLVLGNAKGRLMAVENAFGLPVITTLRAPASGRSVIGGATRLAVDYVDSGNGGTDPLRTRTGYSPCEVCFSDAMQPVVSYLRNTTRTTVWPMGMTPVSRQWVQGSNVLQTVTRTADFTLTTEDFICSDTSMLVRRFTVRNAAATALPFRLIHYAPVNPSGRELTTWTTNWQQFSGTNSCAYDAARDCLTFKADSSAWWVMGADLRSSGHQCAAFPGTKTDIGDGVLGGVSSAGPSTVDAALSFDSTLAPGDSFTVAIYLARIGTATSSSQALQTFDASYRNRTAASLHASTLAFWQIFLSRAVIPAGGSQRVVDLTKRLLMTMKAAMWDNGGISAVPGELSPFYCRDGLAPALAFSLYGYGQEAKAIVLALEAYMTKSWNINFQSYDSSIAATVAAGFTDATTFTDIRYFSYDDPALALSTIGEIWRNSGRTDTAFVRQTWPFVKHLVRIGLRDRGPLGTIGQNNGFQDDMMSWAFNREGSGGKVGMECSYMNMIWVAGLEEAAVIARALGHAAESTTYDSLAASIRGTLEDRFWSDALQEYAYTHDPAQTASYAGNTNFVAVPDGQGGQFVFPRQPVSEGECMPYWVGYAEDARAAASYEKARAWLHSRTDCGLRTSSLVTGGGYYQTTIPITALLYAQARRRDAEAAQTTDWLVRNAPLGGLPEVLPTNNRGIQVWMCGTALRALHAYLSPSATPAAGPGTLAGVHRPAGITVRMVDGRPVIEASPSSPATITVTMLNPAGRVVWTHRCRAGTAGESIRVAVPLTVALGTYVVTADGGSHAVARRFPVTR